MLPLEPVMSSVPHMQELWWEDLMADMGKTTAVKPICGFRVDADSPLQRDNLTTSVTGGNRQDKHETSLMF